MITEQGLQEAIAECTGQRNPTASTCVKLAAFYILKDHLFPSEDHPYPLDEKAFSPYSYDPPPCSTIELKSGSEFAEAVNGRSAEDVMPVMDELMDALQVLNPAFYASVMRKLDF